MDEEEGWQYGFQLAQHKGTRCEEWDFLIRIPFSREQYSKRSVVVCHQLFHWRLNGHSRQWRDHFVCVWQPFRLSFPLRCSGWGRKPHCGVQERQLAAPSCPAPSMQVRWGDRSPPRGCVSLTQPLCMKRSLFPLCFLPVRKITSAFHHVKQNLSTSPPLQERDLSLICTPCEEWTQSSELLWASARKRQNLLAFPSPGSLTQP